MKVYIDALLLINYLCDFLILSSVSLILRRQASIKRILLSSLIGIISLVTLFISINSILLFLLKILLGSIMIVVCFRFKNFKYFFDNITYFFINSLILGGSLYFINLKIELYYNISNSLFINFVVLIIFSPIIIYIYIKTSLKLKNFYSLVYKIEVYEGSTIVKLNGYLDTGNNIVDPYKKRNIIIVNKNLFENINKNILLVPCNTINGSYLLRCFKPDNIYIKGCGFKNNILIGLSNESIKIDGIDCLLNKKILEEM